MFRLLKPECIEPRKSLTKYGKIKTNNMSTELKTKVMRRVYMVTYLRRALSPFALKSYGAIFSIWAMSKFVWVARVIENAPSVSNPMGDFRFFTSAFVNTDLIVQALILTTVAFGLWLVKDLVSSRHLHSPQFSPFLSRAI